MKPRPPPVTIARIVALTAIGLLVLGLGVPPLRAGRRRCLGTERRHRRPADPRALPVRHGERQLRGRLRHARRAGEPRRPEVPADRVARHPDPCSLGASGNGGLPPRGRPRNHEHEVRRTRAGSPATTTSSWSATAASTDRCGSTAPRSCSALKHSTGFLRAESQQAYADGFAACAKRLTADGIDLAGYTLPEKADDLEAARVAMGYGRSRPRQRERRHPHRDDLRLAATRRASTGR